MKLRNKKTGVVVETSDSDLGIMSFNSDIRIGDYNYNSLTELNDEWEDYEEAKEDWYIEAYGVISTINKWGCFTTTDIEVMKALGNYFKTKEEAEKAVEKLKALKRLKDKGFKFEAYKPYGVGITFTIAHMDELAEDNKKDLDLLFGGE